MEQAQYDLDYAHLNAALDTQLAPGTFNVMFTKDFELGAAPLMTTKYMLWPCTVKVEETEGEGFQGWVIQGQYDDAAHPRHIEIVSNWHFRSILKKGNWPAFVVEVELKC